MDITKKKNLKEGIADPTKSWDIGHDLMTQVSEMIVDSIDTDLIVLNAIQKQIRPKCKHPKKLHDKDSEDNMLLFYFKKLRKTLCK